MKDGNPSNTQNWGLVCSACGAEFAATETIDLAGGHFKQEHPDLENAHFNTVWLGKGPRPSKRGGNNHGPRGRR